MLESLENVCAVDIVGNDDVCVFDREEEIGLSPFAGGNREKSIIDYYVSGWSGVPSANLESRVKNSLADVLPCSAPQ